MANRRSRKRQAGPAKPPKRGPDSYAPPVDALLTLGNPGGPHEPPTWRDEPMADYAAMGIGPEHVPDLVRMMKDSSLSQLADRDGNPREWLYAEPHAARALAVLGDLSVLPEMFGVLRRIERLNDDGWCEDLSGVMAHFGPEAIGPISRVARDVRESFGVQLMTLDALEQIAQADDHGGPAYTEVVSLFRDVLRYAKYNQPAINGFIVSQLVALSADEALPEIREAYRIDAIEPDGNYKLDDVEIEIKLTPEQRKALWKERTEAFEQRLEAEARLSEADQP